MPHDREDDSSSACCDYTRGDHLTCTNQRNSIETQSIWRRIEYSDHWCSDVVGVRQRQERYWRKYNDRHAVGEGGLRRQADSQGQWFHRPGKRNDPFCQGFRTSLSGQSLNYTANGSGAEIGEFLGRQTDFGGSTRR
jgi:hypothetical protein